MAIFINFYFAFFDRIYFLKCRDFVIIFYVLHIKINVPYNIFKIH